MLLAIDGNQRIVGANRMARTSPMLDDRGLRAGSSLWSIFERDDGLFRRQGRADFSVRLLVAASNDSRPALVTPPDQPMTASSNAANRNLHERPRLGSIDVSTLPPAPQAYGGLSPGAMRRVREYLELHLGESIDLSMLAESPGYQCIILRDNLSIRRGHAAFLPHAKASRTSPGDVGSDESLVSGSCVRRGLFRPRSPSASLSPYARYDPSRASVVATLGTNDVLDSHTPLGTKPVHRALSRRMVAMVDTLASHLGNNNAISCLR